MPAKSKYLSPASKRISKVTVAVLGSYVLTMAIHLAVAVMLEDKSPLIFTTGYSAFFMWVFFMVMAFLINKAWHVWGLYSIITMICTAIIYIFK
ncbi:MAG: hypothetical protein MI921_18055 [Cytophagales bacterium]|nr:hypothetical protein [Cytophagales bacterium]